MKNRRDRIIAIIASVLAIVIVCLTCIYASTPRLPPWEKDKILNEFNIVEVSDTPIWYEDNGYVEEPGVMRYIGTYGDCYAFLIIGFGTGATMEPYEGPVEVRGLSRPVYYPVEAHIGLYHTKRTFRLKGTTLRAWCLSWLTPEYRQEWLTDAQLERLTRDVEKLAKEHS